MPPEAPATLVDNAVKTAVPLWQDCLVSLAFPEMESRFRTMDAAANGTCAWVLTHSEFVRWVACDGGLLWIKGNPGSGKSTLLKYVLEHCHADRRHLYLSFFFHGRGSELQRTRLGLFRSLLHQILHHMPDALPHLLQDYQLMRTRYGAKLQWYGVDLCTHLESALSTVLQTQTVYIFVDALDECGKDDGGRLLRDFRRLFEKVNPFKGNALRICFTCRHQPEWKWQPEYEILVDQQNRDDISVYVQAQLSCIDARFSRPVVEGSQGSFLWAHLAVKRVLDKVDCRTWRAIEDDILPIPPELNAMYGALMEGAGSDSIKLAQWICFSARPLSIAELRWAMFIEPGCQHSSLAGCEADAGFVPNDAMMKKIVGELSRGLIETDQVSDTRQVVQFIHQSVKDYFVNEFLGGVSSVPGKTIARANVVARTESAHRLLSRICLRYLAMKEVQELAGLNNGMEVCNFALLPYATSSWVTHLRRSDIGDSFAWLPTACEMDKWVELCQTLQRYSPDCPPRGTTLIHVLSRYGIVGALAAALPMRYGETDVGDEHGRSPLSWAAASGQKAAVQMLLSTRRVLLNTTDRDGWTPLWYAAANMHQAMIQMLLTEYGANVHVTDKNGQTLTTWAASNGQTAITKLLLATGKASANARDRRGWTPLLSAACHGHQDIVEQLLHIDVDLVWDTAFDVQLLQLGAAAATIIFADFLFGLIWLKHADVFSRPRRFISCLPGMLSFSLASGKLYRRWMGGSLERRRLLPQAPELEHAPGNIDICSGGWYSRVLLIWAMERENKSVIALLLAKAKIYINHKDRFGRTILLWAAEDGYTNSVKILLAMAGVNADDKDNRGDTPLLCAARNEQAVIVKDLIATDKVNINASNYDGQTPLLAAAKNGDGATVQQLLASPVVHVDAADKYGITPLLWAAINAHESVVEQLLINDASVELRQLPLISGALPFDIVNAHLPEHYHHPNLTGINWCNFSPLRSEKPHRAVVRLLLPDASGILHDRIMDCFDGNDWCGKVLLFWAARKGYTTIVDLLANSDEIIANASDGRVEAILQQLGTDRENRRHESPREFPPRERAQFDAIRHVNINTTDPYNRAPLQLAAMAGHEDIVQQFLALQAVDIDVKDFFGYTPLLWAALNKQQGIARQLLRKGASIDWEDPTLWPWLQRIARLLARPIITYYYLLACFFSMVANGSFYYFFKSHRAAVVRLLLPDGSSFLQSGVQIDVELEGWFSRTLLLWAVEERFEAIVDLLVDVRRVDVNGEAMVRLLLAKETIVVDVQDRDGRTALSWAAANGHETIVKLLMDNGSVVTIGDKTGREPARFAADNGRNDIVDLLESGTRRYEKRPVPLTSSAAT
ncbi:hypothetical protein LLEC1_03252 [Akanthomyces lecanii]|uniref:Nephrocystin 3-like N-terminal domain-containing protein n=1 Tax=Cordyceps confragosa TaxID=2714763 RepID=A0A179IJ16_CORDF|nr:hypothetical protein LLEC1_03252 [Akanthomyces lecanii]